MHCRIDNLACCVVLQHWILSKNETTERKTEIRGKRASQEVIDIINSRNSFARPKSTLPTVEKSTVGGTLPKSSALADINKELSTLTAEFDAKERKYTNEYWQSRLDEETSRLYTLGSVNSPHGIPTTNTGAEAWLLVDEEKNAWETERADLRKKIMDLSSMKKVYEGMSVLSAPDYAEYSAKGAEITPPRFLPDMMTEDEIGAYQYIVAKDGKDRAANLGNSVSIFSADFFEAVNPSYSAKKCADAADEKSQYPKRNV